MDHGDARSHVVAVQVEIRHVEKLARRTDLHRRRKHAERDAADHLVRRRGVLPHRSERLSVCQRNEKRAAIRSDGKTVWSVDVPGITPVSNSRSTRRPPGPKRNWAMRSAASEATKTTYSRVCAAGGATSGTMTSSAKTAERRSMCRPREGGGFVDPTPLNLENSHRACATLLGGGASCRDCCSQRSA